MQFLDQTLDSAAANLALDEALLLQAEADTGSEVLRLWEWPAPAVVLGSGCRLDDDVDEAACIADGIPLLRRSSGGGTVLLGPGCLLYSLVLAYERSPLLGEIGSSYHFILDRVGQALGGPATGIRRAGISDLAIGDRKFSGNAQQRKRNHLLHHGTVLHAFDIERIGRYLRPPPRQPEYRAGRSHTAFLCNLPQSAAEVKQRLQSAWGAEEETVRWEEEQVRSLVAEKYALASWTRRR